MLGAHEAVGAHLDVVEVQLPLQVRVARGGGDVRALQPRRVHVDDEQRQQTAAGLLVGAGARHHEQRVGVLDAGDEDLRPAQHVGAVALGGRHREVVRVRARVGLGDGEGDLEVASADATQPAVLLLGIAVTREHAPGDGGRDHDEQERGSRARDLLPHGGQLGHSAPAAVVLLGDVHAEVALVGEGRPQLGRRLAALDLLPDVGGAEVRADPEHRLAQQRLLLGGDEGESGHGLGGHGGPSITARGRGLA